MKNQLNSGSMDNLELGQSLLTIIRKVKSKDPKYNDKYSMEIAEMILKPNASFNFVGVFNASDNRFRQSSPRRAWLTGEAADIKRLLNIDVESLTFEEVSKGKFLAQVNILNPTAKGLQMRVQIVESTEPTEFQLKNVEKAAKQVTNNEGKTVYFKKEGKFIFANAFVKGGTFENVFIDHDEITEEGDFSAMQELANSLTTIGETASEEKK